MVVALLTIGRKGVRKEFALRNGPLVIGRKVDADLRVPQAEVSRAHCEIAVSGKKVTLRDLGSSNGTFVNDRKVKQTDLKAGDRIQVGSVVFVVQVDGVPKDIGKPVPGRTPAAPAVQEKAKAGPTDKTRPMASPGAKAPVPAGAAPAAQPGVGEDTDAFDIDELGELDIDELSDLDLADIADEAVAEGDAADEEEDSSDLEEVEEIEEIDESELLADDQPEDKPKKK